MQDVVANANRISSSLIVSAASLQQLLNAQTGSLAKSMNNVNAFTSNLNANNERINSTMSNLEKTTQSISQVDINGTFTQLRASVDRLNAAMEKVDSKEGSIGLLLNDKQIYNNMANTTRSLNILMDDIRVNPKRYVSISVFGKKNKGDYLTSPLPVDSSSSKK
jgi:phospholipid/cholesterol/gamma-HCH transport system substrate-binding protein